VGYLLALNNARLGYLKIIKDFQVREVKYAKLPVGFFYSNIHRTTTTT